MKFSQVGEFPDLVDVEEGEKIDERHVVVYKNGAWWDPRPSFQLPEKSAHAQPPK